MKRLLVGLLIACGLHAQANVATQATALASASITSVTSKSGVLVKIIVGTAVANATLKVWDLNTAGCTGTPAGPVYTLTLPATVGNPFEVTPNLNIVNGICALASSSSLLVTFNYN